MHSRIKSDTVFVSHIQDLQQSTSNKILKSELDLVQSEQTEIYTGMFKEFKQDAIFSPVIKTNHSRNSQFLVNENDQEFEEHSIWEDAEQIPVGNNKENKLISFLELYKYRQESTTKKPVSSYNVIQMTKKLINRHYHCKIKYSGIDKVQWIDFRDWTK
ncbi:unnamed protein product [Paramecium sonneborni]|uniref:Uncharacterized protein n=1 Tax=Paramecium sonneborni TaxID=65129 RepID=A0A8S1PKN7_9CILI|nr:unnamed protein product [Paramecium sonneborni]